MITNITNILTLYATTFQYTYRDCRPINVSLGIAIVTRGRTNILTSREREESDIDYLCAVLLEDGGGRGTYAAVGPSDILQH